MGGPVVSGASSLMQHHVASLTTGPIPSSLTHVHFNLCSKYDKQAQISHCTTSNSTTKQYPLQRIHPLRGHPPSLPQRNDIRYNTHIPRHTLEQSVGLLHLCQHHQRQTQRSQKDLCTHESPESYISSSRPQAKTLWHVQEPPSQRHNLQSETGQSAGSQRNRAPSPHH